jgi:hypothetical protein
LQVALVASTAPKTHAERVRQAAAGDIFWFIAHFMSRLITAVMSVVRSHFPKSIRIDGS